MELSDFEMETLREIGNIGASHAAASLGDAIEERMDMSFPETELIEMGELEGKIKADRFASLVLPIEGGITGTILLIYPYGENTKLFTKVHDLDTLAGIGHDMVTSFADSMSSFFGLPVAASDTPVYSTMEETSLTGAIAKLGFTDKTLSFNTEFSTGGSRVCRLFMFLSPGDISILMGLEVPEFAQEFESLSDMVGVFEQIANIEEKLNEIIFNVDVPPTAKREFLRASSDEDLNNTKLARFIGNLIKNSGIGSGVKVQISGPLKYRFTVTDCNVCKISSEGTSSKVCYTTTSGLGRLFFESLGIGNTVDEVECTKGGFPACVHEVALEQLDVFTNLPTEQDVSLLNALAEGTGIAGIGIPEEDIAASIGILGKYNILQGSGDSVQLTDLGKLFKNIAKPVPSGVDDGDWDDIDKILKEAQEAPSIFEGGDDAPPWE